MTRTLAALALPLARDRRRATEDAAERVRELYRLARGATRAPGIAGDGRRMLRAWAREARMTK